MSAGRNNEIETRGLARLGLYNGLVIGLALAAGLWLPALMSLLSVPVNRFPLGIIAVSALLVTALCALAGWVSARLHHVAVSLLIWLLTAILIVLLVGYRSYQLSTLAVWVVEPVLLGQAVFPPQSARLAGIILSGLFILLALVVLALLQEYRLQGVLGELQPRGGLTTWGWTRLALPAVLLLAAGLVTGNIFGDRATSRQLRDLDMAIQVARTYDGDLFQRGLEDGINYAALRAVQDRLAPDYTMTPVQTDPESGQTIVAVRFANGAWIDCRFIYEQLTFCDDASAPYTQGFAALVRGAELALACEGCLPQADQTWRAWLQERRSSLGDDPQITFIRRHGANVLMQARADDGRAAIRCWFAGLDPVRLLSCQEVRP